MGPFETVRRTIKYSWGVAKFLREREYYDDAHELIDQMLADRESNFLAILEDAIYANPDNPYYRMLEHAGLNLDDVRRLVAERGLEAALEELYDAGVYVTHNELRGRAPVKRDGLEFPVKPADFDNPLIRQEFVVRTSGSTGTASRVSYQYTTRANRALQHLIAEGVNGDRPSALWTQIGVFQALSITKRGRHFDRVFRTSRFRFDPEDVQIFASVIVAKLMRRRVPWPRFVPRDKPIKLVRWLEKMTAAGTPAVVHCHASLAVRLCLEARKTGLDISGTLFAVVGEPYTSGKRAVLESVGAMANVAYMSIEMGYPVAVGCLTPSAADDMHVMTTRLAMISRERKNAAGESVDAMLFTMLQPTHGKLLINWESTDYATIEERECGCHISAMGFKTHISDVQSYEKLTSEGVTFSGSWLYDLVEVVLPARFGGSIGDYQLAEEEDENGIPRLRIVVSPSIGAVDEQDVIDTVMNGLIESHGVDGAGMARHWRQGNTLQVVRREPQATLTNKIAPLRVRSRDVASTTTNSSTR